MSKTTPEANPDLKQKVIDNCWQYIHENFHKFSQTNQIKISLEICKKGMPTEISGALNVTLMPEIKVGEKKLEFHIG